MVVGLELVLSGVKQEPGCGGINTTIGIMNLVGRLTGTVVRNDANNNFRDASSIQGSGNNIIYRGRVRGISKELHLCRVNRGVVTGSKECLYCLFFVLIFL